MTLKETLKQLETLTDEKTRKHNLKKGVGENQYGVKLGDIRKIAKKIKTNQILALELWKTENFDAQMLAILIIKPKELTSDELDTMVRSVKYERVADWINSYVVKLHPDNEMLRQKWMRDENPMAARAGWNLTSLLVIKKPEMVDIPTLLDRIENEMLTAAPETQWTMNFSLVEIGIHHPQHRVRAIEIGEKLGVYQDYPNVKGCTSPFAPIWINEMVSRQDNRQTETNIGR
ncbi:DNA alkylation repair protein [uncultured Kordia sp.]|uniref:DNA alkylation repair protein n=1 Tax=uncultured Kordia sp. TaxID=507699 RepID=UPI002612881F|nr:DNA alkylation repair protein [uncultured Kordia sp.]